MNRTISIWAWVNVVLCAGVLVRIIFLHSEATREWPRNLLIMIPILLCAVQIMWSIYSVRRAGKQTRVVIQDQILDAPEESKPPPVQWPIGLVILVIVVTILFLFSIISRAWGMIGLIQNLDSDSIPEYAFTHIIFINLLYLIPNLSFTLFNIVTVYTFWRRKKFA